VLYYLLPSGEPALSYSHIYLITFCENGKESAALLFNVRWQRRLYHDKIPSMPDEIVVEVKDLVKAYGDVKAVRGISFNIAKGEVFGMLGRMAPEKAPQ